MKIIRINTGDILEMKKPHPCGSRFFKVMKTGSDVRVICQSCGRDVTVAREKLERSVKSVITDGCPDKTITGIKTKTQGDGK